MKNGITSTGFAYAFDEQNANDMRVLVHVKSMIDPEATPLQRTSALVELPELLLGKEQTAALYKHLAELHAGRVPPAELERELTEIMRSGDPVKN